MKKIVLLSIALASITLSAQDKNLFAKEIFEGKNATLPYRIMYPEDYRPEQKYPLILFLHGSGERGDDNEKQLIHGSDFFIKYNRKIFPAIVIAPQCPQEDYWGSRSNEGNADFEFRFDKEFRPSLGAVSELVQSFIASGKTDERRVYVGGLSMGGMGAFELIQKMPDVFAAAFPICGGGDPSKTEYASNTALWIFHGEDDNVVSCRYSEKMYDALKKVDADVRFSLYPGVRHNAWDNAFADTELMPWLFGHRKCAK